VDTNMVGTARDSAVTQIHQERNYPHFDCNGSYLLIWERLLQTEGRAEAIARQVHRGLSTQSARKPM
jgi:hypothetical protein